MEEAACTSMNYLASNTVRNILRLLHKLFDDAVEEEKIAYNPANRLRRPRGEPYQPNVPSPSDLRRLLRELPAEYMPLFLTGGPQ